MGVIDVLECLIAVSIPLGGAAFVNLRLVKLDWKSSYQWSKNLKKPSWAPPTWLFRPMWTTLYILMGVSSFIVVKQSGGIFEAGLPILVYAINIIFNFAWSPICFGLKKLHLAFIDILLTYSTAILTAILFYQVSTLAGLLLVPLCGWLTIASCLNYNLVKMNPPYA